MKTLRFLTTILIAFVVTGIHGCSKSEDDPAAPDTYISDLSAAPGWVNVADPADFMFFFSTPPASANGVGTFQGNRQGTADAGSFTGNVNHSSIDLTFTSGTLDGRVFSGKIEHGSSPTVINITSPASGGNPAITLKFQR